MSKVHVKDAKRIREILIKNGKSVRGASIELGLSEVTMWKVLSDDSTISPATAHKVLNYLDLAFDDVFKIEHEEVSQ